MNKHRIVALAILSGGLLPATPALTAPASAIDRDAEQKTLVDRLVLDRATTLTTAEKRAFDRERTLLAQLDERDKQLRRSLAQRKQSEAEAASTRSELLHVTAERERLVADIATAERGRADFPFLRNFDAYEGHSWAVGIGGAGEYGALGNNQESSSEAVNAWAALVLWGEVTGRSELRDLGIFLFTSEVEAINHYWFDLHRIVFAPEYRNVEASMVFGGKYAHNTWWTDEPRQTKGINLLPVTTASTALARHPDYIRRNLAALADEQAVWAARGKKVDPPDIWQDIFAKYLALADPAAALAQWNPRGSVEDGETPSHTLHWMLSLQDMGVPDFSVAADTTLYQVFHRSDGRRTYLAYNAGKAPITVRFSDGKVLEVAPGSLARGS